MSPPAEENMIQERRPLRKDVPQMVKQQLPKHQLHKNNSHKVSPSLNNSHKARLSLNNNHKARLSLIPSKNMSHHNSAAMMMRHFQICFPHPQRLSRQKIQNLYQRNQNIVKTKVIYVIPLPDLTNYTCFYFLFTDPEKNNKLQTRKLLPLCIFT